MLYEARIESDKLILADSFSRAATVEIALGDLARLVGAVQEEESIGDRSMLRHLDVFLKGREGHILSGLTLDQFKSHTPGMVEIEAMTCAVPFDVAFPDDGSDQESAEAFIRSALNDVAAGKPSDDGWKVRALVNASAVASIEDAGTWRDIHLKEEFGTNARIHTVLSVKQLNAALGLNGPT